MKKEIYKTISVILFLLFIPQMLWAEKMIIFPAWQPGETWIVKAVYHSIMNKDEWSEPVFWEYKVTDIKDNGSEKYYIIDVKEQKESKLNLTARLTYQTECKKITCGSEISEKCNIPILIKAEITKFRQGKESVNILEYEKGVPVWTEQTLIPFDTPVFPLCSESSLDFTVIRKISDELKVKETVRQDVQIVKGIKEIPDLLPEKEIAEIKCVKKDKTIFVQYWSENIPFPLFGWNENMKYWLIK